VLKPLRGAVAACGNQKLSNSQLAIASFNNGEDLLLGAEVLAPVAVRLSELEGLVYLAQVKRIEAVLFDELVNRHARAKGCSADQII
jgi:hypothetical protein